MMIKNSYLTVPTNRTGSCGITVSLVRRSSKLMVQISTSSMKIVPLAGSARRNKAIPSDDFPENSKAGTTNQTAVAVAVIAKHFIKGTFKARKWLCVAVCASKLLSWGLGLPCHI